jgi:hypothetical protein
MMGENDRLKSLAWLTLRSATSICDGLSGHYATLGFVTFWQILMGRAGTDPDRRLPEHQAGRTTVAEPVLGS